MTDRNVVLVTIDSLRADHCGFMGYDRDTTPTLDRIAADGLTFENAVSPGTKTPQSLPVMMTGQFPVDPDDGTGMDGARDRIGAHMAARETLAERMSRMGYATAAFTPNPWTSSHFGFDDGFDHFVDFLDRDQSSSLFERTVEGRGNTAITGVRLVMSWMQNENTFKPWESFYDEALAWVRSQDEPYFLWLFLLDPHFPYLPDRSSRTQSLLSTHYANLQLYLQDQTTPYGQRTHDRLVRAYDDAIRYTDDFFARLTADLGDEADVVVTADHGEAFGEHGTYGHHHRLYDENVHVPLVVAGDRWEGTVEQPLSLASLPDVVSAIAAGDRRGVETAGKPLVSISPDNDASGLRGRTWKYWHDESSGDEELYDLASDPDERANLASDPDERDDHGTDVEDTSAFRDYIAATRGHLARRSAIVETVERTADEVGDQL